MKKRLSFLLLLFTLLFPWRVQAQGANWLDLQSDHSGLQAAGETVTLSIQAMLNTAINGASFILQYDPQCFKVSGYQPGTLLPGATAFAQQSPGQLDLTYYFQGKGQGLAGEGSLVSLQLEALQLCDSQVSIDPGTITLGVLDSSNGLALRLPDVSYRALSLRFAPVNGAAAAAPQEATSQTAVSAQNAPTAPALPGLVWLGLGIALVLLLGLDLLALLVLKRPRHAGVPASHNAHTGKGSALLCAGRRIPLPPQRTLIGRHIEIIHQNGTFFVADTGSRLGVFLNGNRLGKGYHPLRHGDQVQLGREVSYQFVQNRQVGQV